MIDNVLTRFGYAALFAMLLGAGVGVPFPEEPTQLAAGVRSHEGYLLLVPAMVTCWTGIVAGDLAWFRLARRLGPAVLSRRPIRRVLTPERRARVEAHLSRHAFLTVLVSRHLSGLRLPAFALAATHGVRRRTFVLADGLSALASVPLVVSAGYLGAQHLTKVRSDIRTAELAILALVIVGGLVVLVVRRVRRVRCARQSADTPAARREA